MVVMIHDKKLIPKFQHSTMQLRYIVAGLAEPPYRNVLNARYVMAGTRVPFEGQWIHFTARPVRDFKRAYGWVPEDFEAIEVFFEVRYDDPVTDANHPVADVYWDDMSLVP